MYFLMICLEEKDLIEVADLLESTERKISWVEEGVVFEPLQASAIDMAGVQHEVWTSRDGMKVSPMEEDVDFE